MVCGVAPGEAMAKPMDASSRTSEPTAVRNRRWVMGLAGEWCPGESRAMAVATHPAARIAGTVAGTVAGNAGGQSVTRYFKCLHDPGFALQFALDVDPSRVLRPRYCEREVGAVVVYPDVMPAVQ